MHLRILDTIVASKNTSKSPARMGAASHHTRPATAGSSPQQRFRMMGP